MYARLGAIVIGVALTVAIPGSAADDAPSDSRVELLVTVRVEERYPNPRTGVFSEHVRRWMRERLNGIATVDFPKGGLVATVRCDASSVDDIAWRLEYRGTVRFHSAWRDVDLAVETDGPDPRRDRVSWSPLESSRMSGALAELLGCSVRRERGVWQIALRDEGAVGGESLLSARVVQRDSNWCVELTSNARFPTASHVTTNPDAGASDSEEARVLLMSIDGRVIGWDTSPDPLGKSAILTCDSRARAKSIVSVFEGGTPPYLLRISIEEVTPLDNVPKK
jgi:hypothetical protein